MIYDTIRLVDAPNYDRDALVAILQRRLEESEDTKLRPYSNKLSPQDAENQRKYKLNKDLTAILRGKIPRMYGEMPVNPGKYRRLCPNSAPYDSLMKLKQQYIKGTLNRADQKQHKK